MNCIYACRTSDSSFIQPVKLLPLGCHLKPEYRWLPKAILPQYHDVIILNLRIRETICGEKTLVQVQAFSLTHTSSRYVTLGPSGVVNPEIYLDILRPPRRHMSAQHLPRGDECDIRTLGSLVLSNYERDFIDSLALNPND